MISINNKYKSKNNYTTLSQELECSIYDAESDLQMLGFRIYDNETGRFTTPDLLWSAFPAQTPYHYAYNSPLTYRDPSGLAPEKEKEGEELMGLFDWTAIEEGLASVSRFIASLQNSIYDAGQTSPYALKSEGGGERTSGSNSSANNGQGGNESDENKSGGSSEGLLKRFYNFFKKLITGKSEWVWDGVDYGSRDALVAATSRNNGEGAANDGIRRSRTQEVVVTGRNEYGYSGDNLFDECFIQYQMGKKGDFHVNANALNLNWVSQSDLKYKDGLYSVNLVSPKFGIRMISQGALALGSINLTKIGDEIYRINNEEYDFDIRWDEGYSVRNILTAVAGLIHGPVFDNKPIPIIGEYSPSVLSGSGSFTIIFHGTVRIRK